MDQRLKQEIIVEHDEEFEITSYNNITVIKHVKSGYYNASKICSNNGKNFKHIKRNQSYHIKINSVSELVHIPTSEFYQFRR